MFWKVQDLYITSKANCILRIQKEDHEIQVAKRNVGGIKFRVIIITSVTMSCLILIL